MTAGIFTTVCRSHKPTTGKGSINAALQILIHSRNGTWSLVATATLHYLLRGSTHIPQKQGSLYHNFTAPSLWDPPVATFIAAEIGVSKSDLSSQKLKRVVEAAITSGTSEEAVSH